MQMNLVQFLGALTAGFTQGLSAEAGIVTLESGDTFDVKENVKALENMLSCASSALKDAADELSRCGQSKSYPHTRGQLLEYRELLTKVLNTPQPNIKPDVPPSSSLEQEVGVLASALKDIINSAENGQAYTFEELTGPSFAGAREIMSKYDPENPEQPHDKGTPPVSQTAESDMSVSLDGGVTFQPAPSGVRIVYDKVDVPGEDEQGQLHINVTSEGIITDVWVSREEHLDHNIGTSNNSIDGIISDLVEEGA